MSENSLAIQEFVIQVGRTRHNTGEKERIPWEVLQPMQGWVRTGAVGVDRAHGSEQWHGGRSRTSLGK